MANDLVDKDRELVHVRMLEAQAHERFGKMKEGDTVQLARADAQRWCDVGISEPISKSEYSKSQEKVADARGGVYNRMVGRAQGAQATSTVWDNETHRDPTLAEPEHLKEAIREGVPLVNTSSYSASANLEMLEDEGLVSEDSHSNLSARGKSGRRAQTNSDTDDDKKGS